MLLAADTFRCIFTHKLRWKLFLNQIVEIGLLSQLVVVITGGFTGAVFAAQTFFQFNKIGMGSATGAVVSVSICRELGPVLTALMVAGRVGAAIHTDRSLRKHLTFGPDVHVGVDAIWMAVNDLGFVDRRLWDNAGTIELGPWWSMTKVRGNREWRARAGVTGGIVYRNPGPGIQAKSRFDIEAFGRPTGELSLRTPVLGVRLFFGAYYADTNFATPLQRRIMVAGADPYTTFTNPLLRSRGALFVRPDFHYQAPGGPGLRLSQ